MRNRTSAILMALLLALMGASAASAQETTGTLTGKLTDTQGLVVPGATVTVTGPQGARSFTTDTVSVSPPTSILMPTSVVWPSETEMPVMSTALKPVSSARTL